jgi:hypothetical protein
MQIDVWIPSGAHGRVYVVLKVGDQVSAPGPGAPLS